MVWLVLGGPALVIVAGIATAVIAFRHADTELHGLTPVAAFSIRMGAESRLSVGSPANSTVRPAAAPAATTR